MMEEIDMDLIVKRYTLRHNGIDYVPGTLLKNIPDDEAAEIIRVADGDVEALKTEAVAEESTPSANTDKGLPPVDPKATVGRKK